MSLQIINSYEQYINKSKYKTLLSIVADEVNSKIRAPLNDLVSAYYHWLNVKMPVAIEVETINKCDNDCSFCPVNRTVDPRPYEKMSDYLLEKIASELAERRYDGLLGIFSNNEPLLDRRIIDICTMFRKSAPCAHIYMYTNGVKLNSIIYQGLFESGLDEMIIDNYSDDLCLIPSVRALLEQLEENIDQRIERYMSNTVVYIRKKNEVLTNRGGLSPNKSKEEVHTYEYLRNHSCTLPFIQLVIRPSGEISMCCQDATGKATLGDLNRQSIHEVWNGPVYAGIRKKLREQGRKALPLCECCDVTIYYKAILRKKLADFFGCTKSKFKLCR